MKRFHVHMHVEDLAKSIGFYTQLFSAEPTRTEADYAKWMLEDPRVNFAISTRGSKPGLDHLGFQVDEADELAELKARARSADLALLDEGSTTCCYARSEKHWVTDPQGIAWEHFHTLGDIPVFNENPPATAAGACCSPSTSAAALQSGQAAVQAARSDRAASACCAPAAVAHAPDQAACCTPNTTRSTCC